MSLLSSLASLCQSLTVLGLVFLVSGARTRVTRLEAELAALRASSGKRGDA